MSRVSRNIDPSAQVAITDLTDALDGVAFGATSTLTTSATPTVDELEACVGALAGKVNSILAALRAVGVIAP